MAELFVQVFHFRTCLSEQVLAGFPDLRQFMLGNDVVVRRRRSFHAAVEAAPPGALDRLRDRALLQMPLTEKLSFSP